jgi:hypothetical protein
VKLRVGSFRLIFIRLGNSGCRVKPRLVNLVKNVPLTRHKYVINGLMGHKRVINRLVGHKRVIT